MTKTTRIILIIAVVGIIAVAMRHFRLDDAFITYRYARNIATGVGFVYNPGEVNLSTTNPLYTLLLAGLYLVLPNLPALGFGISVISIAATGVLLALINEEHPTIGLSAALFYVTFPLMWYTLGLETVLLMLCGVAAIFLYTRQQRIAAAVVLGLGTLVRPDLIVLAGLIAAADVWFERRPPWREALAFAGVLLPWVIGAWLAFGSPLPATLGAKSAQAALGITGFSIGTSFIEGLWLIARGLIVLSPLWVLVGLVCVAGVYPVITGPRWAQIAAAWGLSHVAGYIVLGVSPYRWYYAPLVIAFAVLFAFGVAELRDRLSAARWVVPAVLAVLIGSAGMVLYQANRINVRGEGAYRPAARTMLPVVDWDIYYKTGQWLAANTPPDSTVGVAEIGQVGFYAERPMIDYLGLLQPDIAAALEREDIFWWLPHYTPDYLVLSEASGEAALFGFSLADLAWFDALYTERHRIDDPRYLRSPMVVYERRIDPNPVVPLSEGLPGPVITSATDLPDGRTLQPSAPIRVQTTWLLTEPIDGPSRVIVRVRSPDWSQSAQLDRAMATQAWPVGDPFTVYHAFVLPSELPPGGYLVEAAVDEAWQPVGWVRIPISDVPPEDITPMDVEFAGAPIELIGWQREGSTMTLVWSATGTPQGDYTIFVHALDDSGEIAAQADHTPRGGTYPTTLWGAGDVIVDTFTLQLDGDYQVIVGLYDPVTGARVMLPNGETFVTLLDHHTD